MESPEKTHSEPSIKVPNHKFQNSDNRDTWEVKGINWNGRDERNCVKTKRRARRGYILEICSDEHRSGQPAMWNWKISIQSGRIRQIYNKLQWNFPHLSSIHWTRLLLPFSTRFSFSRLPVLSINWQVIDNVLRLRVEHSIQFYQLLQVSFTCHGNSKSFPSG